MDLFRESMDSYRFVGHESELKKIRFVSWITNPDLKRFVSIRLSRIQSIFKDSPVFTNPTNPYESLVLWHETNP